MNGPIGMVESGTEVRLTCSQLEGEAANISIVTPSNLVIRQSMITFNATASNTGNYLCVASVLSVNVTASHYLQVYGKYQVYVLYKVSRQNMYRDNLCRAGVMAHSYGCPIRENNLTLGGILQ